MSKISFTFPRGQWVNHQPEPQTICIMFGMYCVYINSLRPRQNGSLFTEDTFKRIFLNENIRISNKNSLKFVPKGLINNIPALVLIMAWRRPGDKPLSESMLVRSLTHICLTRHQWVKRLTTSLVEWQHFRQSTNMLTWLMAVLVFITRTWFHWFKFLHIFAENVRLIYWLVGSPIDYIDWLLPRVQVISHWNRKKFCVHHAMLIHN